MKKLCLAAPLLLIVWAVSVQAQTRDGVIQAGVGVGAGLNPPMRFDLDISGEYFWDDTFSFGVDFDIFVRGRTSYNLIGFGRYHFQLLQAPRLLPYVGGGLGSLINTAGNGWFDLMLPELGFLFELTPHLFVGPNTSFHFLAGSNTSWDIQALGQIIYRF